MKSTKRFKNKKFFVTGASRGIGKAIAQAFRSEGAWVVGTSTSSIEEPDESCDKWFAADFSDLDQIKHCVDFLDESKPDVLINNAGINKNAPFAKIDPNTFQLIQQVNVFAPFMLCQVAMQSNQQQILRYPTE